MRGRSLVAILRRGRRPARVRAQAEVIKPARRPGQMVIAAVLIVVGVVLLRAVVTNDRFQWGVVGHYLFDPQILGGLVLTIELTVVAMALGIGLGTLLALGRRSANRVVSAASVLYIWFFRGTPLLVQLIFWYNLAALYPQLTVGLPFGPPFVSVSTNSVVTSYGAAILGLGLNEGAYMAEIIRSGIESVDKGQREAGLSLGLTDQRAFRRIVFPQAMRVIIPPTGNQVIGMLKYTSLVSVISLAELLYSAELIYARNFEAIPLLITASVWYLIATSVLMAGQRRLERHFGQGWLGQDGRREVPLTADGQAR